MVSCYFVFTSLLGDVFLYPRVCVWVCVVVCLCETKRKIYKKFNKAGISCGQMLA